MPDTYFDRHFPEIMLGYDPAEDEKEVIIDDFDYSDSIRDLELEVA